MASTAAGAMLALGPAPASGSEGQCTRQFNNGDAISGGFRAGDFLPELEVRNGPTDAAIVRLTNIATGNAHFYFVARGQTAVIASITPGKYLVSFASGASLASDCRTVTSARLVRQFSEPFDLYKTETVDEDGLIYTEVGNNWITLDAQREGKAAMSALGLEGFNS